MVPCKSLSDNGWPRYSSIRIRIRIRIRISIWIRSGQRIQEFKNKIKYKDRYMNNKNTKMTRIRIQEYEYVWISIGIKTRQRLQEYKNTNRRISIRIRIWITSGQRLQKYKNKNKYKDRYLNNIRTKIIRIDE